MSERLLFALWPAPPVIETLEKAWHDFVPARGRPIATRNWHITLIFLGTVDAVMRRCVEPAAGSVDGSPFDVVLDQIEWRRRQRIVWAGATTTSAALVSLVEKLTKALAECGYKAEGRAYRPHVTLVRDVMQYAHSPKLSIAPIHWHVSDFCLVNSRAGVTGSEYTVLRRWPLHSA